MKKIIIRILLILVGLLVVWILINRFDAKLDPDVYGLEDIPAATFDHSNGFYNLWTLAEPPEVDVTSKKAREKYQKLFDPQFDNEKYLKEYDYIKYKDMYKPYEKKYRQLGLHLDHHRDFLSKNWCQEIISVKKDLSSLDPDLEILLRRFRMMMDSNVFEDFISIEVDAPLPNLLAWLHMVKLYTAVNMLTALEGDWDKGVSNLLDLLDFGKRAVKGSRFLIVNLIAKANILISLQAIADLMNQKDCPVSVYEMVLNRTPPLEYCEYGTEKTLICEVVSFTHDAINNPFAAAPYRPFSFWERAIVLLFLQKNRSINYADKFYKQFIEKEKIPPYQWESNYVKIDPLIEGPFWWVWNAGGKFLLKAYNYYTGNHKKGGGLYAVIFKSYSKKTLYDMVRISAELHLNYTPDKPVQQILNSLESYKTTDPCSGKPYKWNDEKQVLYSIGTDRQDNNGDTQEYKKIEGTDFAIPVIMYVK